MEEHGAGGRGFWNAKGKGFTEEERADLRKRGSKREELRPRGESVRERSCRGHGGSSGAECGAAPAAGAPLLRGGRAIAAPWRRGGRGPRGLGAVWGEPSSGGAVGAVLWGERG